MRRIGIIPFDMRDDAIALLFVTSNTRGRWVLPKGRPRKNESDQDTCHREGFEEAGVKGVALTDFPITKAISRQTENGLEPLPVIYYPYLVTEQFDEWPEKESRERHWSLIEDAPKLVFRKDFLAVLEIFSELRPWIKEAAESHRPKPKGKRKRAR